MGLVVWKCHETELGLNVFGSNKSHAIPCRSARGHYSSIGITNKQTHLIQFISSLVETLKAWNESVLRYSDTH